eukprot:TRINITY_DN42457_c0_g1_i1.p1 TRINITY_DN42457_c0_g1~~TRINITY_DN42457_c0_g1_i1.p1  ORF type:complete len:425 (-),score=113.30 TRINITY_DN42457_c0_g1_i1:34-1308(-)
MRAIPPYCSGIPAGRCRWWMLVLACVVLQGLLSERLFVPGQGRSQPRRLIGRPASADSEESDLVAQAKAEAEAAKLRLEAEKLRAEVAQSQAAAASSSLPSKDVEQAASAAPAAPSQAAMGGQSVAPEALNLVSSTELRGAVTALLRLRRSPGGESKLQALAKRACAVLEEGRSGSLSSVCESLLAESGGEAEWQEAGYSLAEAGAPLTALAELLVPQPKGSLPAAGTAKFAANRLITYDQMPDQYKAYGKLLDIEESEGKMPNADGGQDITFMDPGLLTKLGEEERAASRFAGRLELVSEQEQLRSRLQRLKELPLARQVLQLAADDSELVELGDALKSEELRLYGAIRKAQLRANPVATENEVQVINLEFNLAQLIGGLVVAVALAYFTAQGVKSSLGPAGSGSSFGSGDQVPLYSLQRSPK